MQRRLSWRGALAALALTSSLSAQEKVVVNPPEVRLVVGETIQLEGHYLDANGERDDEVDLIFLSRSRRSVSVTQTGEVHALQPGEYTIVARTQRRIKDGSEGQEGRSLLGERISTNVIVTVTPPPIEAITIASPGRGLFTGTTVRLAATAVDVNGQVRAEAKLKWESNQPAVAQFDAFGNLHLKSAGRFTALCIGDGAVEKVDLEVSANPVATVEIEADRNRARTGDVVHFNPIARDARGNVVADVPIYLSFHAEQEAGDQGPGASGQIEQDGRFVAETPGLYTAVATCGAASGRASVEVVQRKVQGKLKEVGRGKVHDQHTSDLWVWEGVDGRDYCVTGTWGNNGDAIFWDVTDPGNIERIATVNVDARTVNDVKVSPDGRLCVLSREGASDRKNGMVIVDVTNPREPVVLEKYTEALTGGVHNIFIDEKEVYALSAGRRYDIIDIQNPEEPKKLSQYELESPGHSIHDVWVAGGLAFSSNWSDGVHIVDVGNGIRDGSPSNPQFVSSYAYPSGWNHAAFPYRNEETGTFYVVAGDEAFPNGLHIADKPTYPRGWLHFIDFTNLDSPAEVARYQVPEAGTHNLWVEGDICYAAFYNGGLRVIDVSGELMGDLYRQGREIAWFLPTDKEGFIPNAPMVWGPQPYKGKIFFSDWNTGLWCVELERGDD